MVTDVASCPQPLCKYLHSITLPFCPKLIQVFAIVFLLYNMGLKLTQYNFDTIAAIKATLDISCFVTSIISRTYVAFQVIFLVNNTKREFCRFYPKEGVNKKPRAKITV